MDALSPEKLKSQIALLEELLRHIVNLPSEENKTKQYDVRK